MSGKRVQRRVIDSNYLRDADLRHYLMRSRSNYIVLTDFVAMELHKTNALVTATKSLAIACEFSSQVLVTKSSEDMLRLSPRGAGLAARLIDRRQTGGFGRYCGLLRASARETSVRRQLEDNEAAAARHMAKVLVDSAEVPKLFQQMASRFTPAELAILRRHEPRPHETQRKLLDLMFEAGRELHRTAVVDRQYWPATYGEAVNTFPFRYALCATLLYIRWVMGGRQTEMRPEKTRNDLIDMNLAAVGTYFDGVLSKDVKLMDIHREARWILRQMGGYVGGLSGLP